jgi:hypothetical protein
VGRLFYYQIGREIDRKGDRKMILKVRTKNALGRGWLHLEGTGFHALDDPPLRTYEELLSCGGYVDDHILGEGGQYMTFDSDDLSSDAEGHVAYQEVSFTDYRDRNCRIVFNDSAYLMEGGKTVERYYGDVLYGSIPIEKEPITGGVNSGNAPRPPVPVCG